MSKRDRNNGIAFGLVIGLGIALLFLVWAVPEFRDPEYAVNYYQQKNDQSTKESSQSAFWWWIWNGGLVSSSDTLAQWIMAAVTIIATFVLLLTLRSANKTNIAAVKASEAALKANEIMREEGRPWMAVDAVIHSKVTITDKSIKADVGITATNIGKRPAYDVWMFPKIMFSGPRGDLINSIDSRFMIEMTNSHNKRFQWLGPIGKTIFPSAKHSIYNFGCNTEFKPGDITELPYLCIFCFYRDGRAGEIKCTAVSYLVLQIGGKILTSGVFEPEKTVLDQSIPSPSHIT